MDSNDIYHILNRHKRDITCDLCSKRVWFFQKVLRFVIRTKSNVWAEYYHVKCLERRGYLRKKEKSGRWDNKDQQDTSNVIH